MTFHDPFTTLTTFYDLEHPILSGVPIPHVNNDNAGPSLILSCLLSPELSIVVTR